MNHSNVRDIEFLFSFEGATKETNNDDVDVIVVVTAAASIIVSSLFFTLRVENCKA